MTLLWRCPVCGTDHKFETDRPGMISCTVRCGPCDSSIGLSLLTGGISVVYTERPQDEWYENKEEAEDPS